LYNDAVRICAIMQLVGAFADGIMRECPRDVHIRSRRCGRRHKRTVWQLLGWTDGRTDGRTESLAMRVASQDRTREKDKSCCLCVFVFRRSKTESVGLKVAINDASARLYVMSGK